ncbi:MAG: DNA gyrase inhibitor YacG [Marinicaulis sp.]|nr:DNA gyrase inhibitor YacG [Marinicaulis sp.]NNL88494.1 DNA gyrase inhibitor YacG [Marinicaulis sp.]
MSNDNSHAKKNACPVCKKTSADDYKPFCSKRCADVDLNRWLTAGYTVPAAEDDSEGVELDEGNG